MEFLQIQKVQPQKFNIWNFVEFLSLNASTLSILIAAY